MESASGEPYLRVLLLGFMASGKTTVGRLVARDLGWTFHDFDETVEAREGMSISEIFRRRGEAAFREAEARVGRELLRKERVVLASGGGWPAREERMGSLPPGTLSVWLRVGPEEAVRRARAQGPVRPLLEGPDAVQRARDLLEEREPHYRQASLILDSESAPPAGLAGAVLECLRVSRSAAGAPHPESE